MRTEKSLRHRILAQRSMVDSLPTLAEIRTMMVMALTVATMFLAAWSRSLSSPHLPSYVAHPRTKRPTPPSPARAALRPPLPVHCRPLLPLRPHHPPQRPTPDRRPTSQPPSTQMSAHFATAHHPGRCGKCTTLHLHPFPPPVHPPHPLVQNMPEKTKTLYARHGRHSPAGEPCRSVGGGSDGGVRDCDREIPLLALLLLPSSLPLRQLSPGSCIAAGVRAVPRCAGACGCVRLFRSWLGTATTTAGAEVRQGRFFPCHGHHHHHRRCPQSLPTSHRWWYLPSAWNPVKISCRPCGGHRDCRRQKARGCGSRGGYLAGKGGGRLLGAMMG